MQESLPGLQGFLLTSRTLGKRTYVIMFARGHPVPTVFVAGGAVRVAESGDSRGSNVF